MKLYLVRHGQTDWNVQGRNQGRTNNPINETGVVQAKLIASKIKKLKIEHFFASPLLRTQQTANIINKNLNQKIIYDDRLIERDSGDIEGKIKHELDYLEDFYQNPHKYNAESWEDVYVRSRNFVDELKQGGIDNIIIVSHAGLLNMIRYCAKEKLWDNNKFKDVYIDNASVLEVDII